jgi:thiamine-phosphate pyrophosphorylase
VSAAARSTLPRLIAITDLSLLDVDALTMQLHRLASLARPGSVALLLRDHAATARQRLALGTALRDITVSTGQALWVADRLDLALLLQADGVHLGEASVSATVARSLVGDGVLVSRAWHATSLLDAAGADELAGVDALLVSPVFEPRKGRPAIGVAALGGLGEQLRARNWACHLYALGGVSAENAASCLRAGAAGVAAIGAALAPDPRPLLSALQLLR